MKRFSGMVMLCLLCLISFCGGSMPMLAAQDGDSLRGIVDLSANGGPVESVSLQGDWEFYGSRLLTPEGIGQHADNKIYAPLLRDRTGGIAESAERAAAEFGTYRLRLQLPDADVGRQKALYISDIASAYYVWVNDQPLGGVGTVGTTAAEEVPKSRGKLLVFAATNAELEIVIQASRFIARDEGTFQYIKFGEADTLIAAKVSEKQFAMLTIGGLFVIGFYHLILYGIRRDDRSVLYIALLALVIGARGWIKDTYLVDLMAPHMSWELIVKLDYLTGYIAYLFLVLLMNAMFPMLIHRKALGWSHAVTVLFCAFIVAAPAKLYTPTLGIQFAIMFAISLYTLAYVCIQAARRKREGALINLFGYAVIAVACMNDVLLYQRVIETVEVLYEAIFVFILLQAILVSYRYSRLMKHNIALSADLRQLNQTLEDRVESRTADLHRKHEELVRMHRSRTEMLANISHDMGSPLIGIQMNMQLIKEGLVPVRQQPEFMESLLDKAAYVKRLNDDLFELSLLESGQLAFHFTKLQLSHYMDNYVRKLKGELTGSGFKLRAGVMETALDGEEVWIHVDPMRINQALGNYAGNAVKFSKGHGQNIELSCRIVPREDNSADSSHEAVIEIRDHGPGIPEDELPHVFNRFYRRNEGTANGSGLGLAIVKEIIERHHGRTGASSQVGHGANFILTIPVYAKNGDI